MAQTKKNFLGQEPFTTPTPTPTPMPMGQSKITPEELANPIPTRKPIFDSQNKRLIGYEYSDGRIALRRGSVSNNALDAEGKPVYRPSGENDIKPTPPPLNVTPEQQAQIGQLDTNILNAPEELTQKIEEMLINYNKPGQSLSKDFEQLSQGDFSVLAPPINKIIDPLARAIPFNIGTSLVNALSTNRAAREYLQDYTQKDNIVSIRKNIQTANQQMTDMIRFAKESPNTPENTKIAIQIYNEAQTRKFKAIAQLKKIAQGDQREYTDSIKDDLTELENYFYRGGKQQDDNSLYVGLNKPTAKYLMTGVGANG